MAFLIARAEAHVEAGICTGEPNMAKVCGSCFHHIHGVSPDISHHAEVNGFRCMVEIPFLSYTADMEYDMHPQEYSAACSLAEDDCDAWAAGGAN
jgi:hypothetical protein